MKKRLLSTVLVLCMVLALLPDTAWATEESGACGDNLTWTLNDAGVLTISGTGNMYDYNYSSVPWYSVRNTSKLRKVVIENGVTSIGNYAFYQCFLLEEITIANSVTRIGSNAIYQCVNLKELVIPEGVADLSSYAFGYNTSLRNIVLPNSVAAIPSYCFEGCGALESVTIPDSIISIGTHAFWNCSKLDNIVIPDSVVEIGSYAFNYCRQLSSVMLPRNLETISPGLFQGCSSLTHIDIPSSVKEIKYNAFEECRSLIDVVIPDGVTTISYNVFEGCTNLKSVVIPRSVTYIGEKLFLDCDNISDIYYQGTEGEWNNIRFGYNALYYFYNATIHYNSSGPNQPDTPDGKIILQLDEDTITVGDETIISAEIPYSSDIQENDVTWSSSNERIATVTAVSFSDFTSAAIARIQGISPGTVTIRVTLADGRSAGVDIKVNSRTEPSGEFRISANTATTCLQKGTTFEMNVGYYQNNTLDLGAQEFIAVTNDSNVLGLTAGSWNNETGRRYIVTARQAGNCSITFTNPVDGNTNKIDFTVVEGETGYTFDGVPKMTIEEGKTTNFYNFSGLVVDDFAYTPHKDTNGNNDYYVVTMTIYNSKNLYGTVTSFDLDGEIYESTVIDKHSDYSTSFVGDLKDLKNSIGDLFYLLGNDKYYSGESISKRTSVSIKVPVNGYLQISNSLSSGTAAFTNVIGMLVEGTMRITGLFDSSDKLVDESADITEAVLNENMKTLLDVFTDNFVEKQVSSELKKTAQKSFKTGTWNLDNYGDFIQSFLDNLTELGIDLTDSIAKKFTASGALSVTESVVKKVIPTGNLINFLYSTLGMMDESLFWLNFQASANFPSGIFIYAPSVGDSYQSNGVSVTPSTQKDSNVVVHAYLVVDTDDISNDKYEMYSINMYRDGKQTQPDATITVRIPLSEKFKGLDKSTIKVYRHNDDGTLTDMNATIVDGYAVFDTDHLSYYSIVSEENLPNPVIYTIILNASPTEGGSVTESNTYNENESVTVRAVPASGYRFVRWTEGSTTASTSATYTFTITKNRTLTAVFEQISSSSGNSTPDYSSSSDSDPTYSISVPGHVTGGTIKVTPTSASERQRVTVTVKPNSGYGMDTLTVTDSKGNTLTLIDQGNGKYMFTMPSSKVNIDVSFKATAPTTSVTTINFADVQPSAYYYNAVAWAVRQGITSGTTFTTFGPDAPCTRAQIVSFLWRAAGSPKMSGTNPFVDVAPSEYYYDAVLWAVANGITAGSTDTTFSPDATCTRAQAMTFLYRAKGTPAVSGTSNFTDLASGAYYTDAVQWAVNTGVTSGTTSTTFSPEQDCTRAQIMSFLYRGKAN